MRKRIVISILAIIGVGVLVFVVSEPKKGSVEYHIREYKRAERELRGETWKYRAGMIWSKLTGNRYTPNIDMSDPNNPQRRSEKHEQALINLGYWEKRQFNLTHRWAGDVMKTLQARELSKDDMAQISLIAPQREVLWIRCRREDMPRWEELVRQVDVPGNVK